MMTDLHVKTAYLTNALAIYLIAVTELRFEAIGLCTVCVQ